MATVNKNVRICYKGEQKLTMVFNNLEINDQITNYVQSGQIVSENTINEMANNQTEKNEKGEEGNGKSEQ